MRRTPDNWSHGNAHTGREAEDGGLGHVSQDVAKGREGRECGEHDKVLRDGGKSVLEGVVMKNGQNLGCLLGVVKALLEEVAQLRPLDFGGCQLCFQLGLRLLKEVDVLVDFICKFFAPRQRARMQFSTITSQPRKKDGI